MSIIETAAEEIPSTSGKVVFAIGRLLAGWVICCEIFDSSDATVAEVQVEEQDDEDEDNNKRPKKCRSLLQKWYIPPSRPSSGAIRILVGFSIIRISSHGLCTFF